MNYKTTLVLFILVIIAIPLAVILPKHLRPTKEAELVKDKVFPDFSTQEARRMEFTKGDLHIACEKVDDTWRIVEPLADHADQAKVEGVLSACEFMRHKGSVKPKNGPVDPAKYGLDEPQAQVTVADKKNTWTLLIGKAVEEIGKQSPGGKNLYVKLKGQDTIYCVGDDILKDITHKVPDFRYRHPFEVLSYRVKKIELTNESGAVILAKDDDEWRLQEPVEDTAESSKVVGIISGVSDAEKQDFTADDVKDFAQYGLDEPAISVRFWSDKEEGTKTLLIGNAVPPAEDEDEKTGKVYARVEGSDSVFTLKDEIVEKLSAGANDLRDRTLLAVKAADVIFLEIKSEESTIAVKKDGWYWKMLEPEEVAADSSAVKDIAKLLEETKIDEWIDAPGDLAQYALDKPVTIMLKQKKDDVETELQLLVGKKEDEACYVKLPAKPAVLKVKGKIADEVARDYLAFRTKRMLDFSHSRSSKLHVVREDGIFFAAAKQEDDKWMLSKPVAGTAEASNVNSILWDLSSFDAKKIVAEQADDLAPYGLDKPRITATVTVKGGEEDKEKTYTVRIGKEVDGDYYAKVDGKDIVFTVPKDVVDHLNKNLLSLRVIRFEKDDATELVVERGEEKLACKRKDKDSDWEITMPEGRKADDKTIRSLINLLLSRVDRYEKYTPDDPAKYGLDKPTTVLTLKLKGDQDNKVLQIGSRLEDGSAYARTADAAPVFVLPKHSVDRLDKAFTDLLAEEKSDEKE